MILDMKQAKNGAAAQEQFGSTDPPANEGIEDNGWADVTAADINKPHSASNETLPQNIDFEGATLTLNSQTTLSLYFTSDEIPEFSCENMTVESLSVGSYKVARIRNIPAKKAKQRFHPESQQRLSGKILSADLLLQCFKRHRRQIFRHTEKHSKNILPVFVGS